MKTVEWTEEVLLSNGQKIVVKRANEYQRVMDVGAGFERGWNFVEAVVEALLPGSQGRRLGWKGFMTPMVLDSFRDGEALLLGVPTPTGRNYWRIPRNEFYVALVHDGVGWKRIPLNDVPESVRPNLFVSSYQFFIEQGHSSGAHVDVGLKRKLDSNPLIGERYRSIIRLPATGSKN